MGAGTQETAGNFVNGKTNQTAVRMMANPLNIGGNKATKFLADPLGLFSGGEKRPFVYDPDRIYSNPQKAERARQMTIKYGTEAVNKVFDDPARGAQRTAFLEAMRKFYTDDANRQKGIADRNRRFSMARGGLTGGSADVDSNRLLGEEYVRGLIDAENKAQGAYAGLTAQDEASRLDLLAQVRAGMDTTTAAARSAAALASSADTAKNDALSKGLGDIFGGSAAVYKDQRDAAERRRGVIDAYKSLYG